MQLPSRCYVVGLDSKTWGRAGATADEWQKQNKGDVEKLFACPMVDIKDILLQSNR